MRRCHSQCMSPPDSQTVPLFVLLLVLPILAYGFSSGPPNGVTGAPGEGTCVDCHSDFPLNSGPGSFNIEGPPTFEPGMTYTISVTLAQEGQSRWGFEFSPLDAGSCTITDPTTTQLDVEGGNTYVKHTAEGTYEGNPGPTMWSFDWTAPVDAPEEITFYAAGNAANGNGSTGGDYIYTTTFTMGLVPVELTQFTADLRSGYVVLHWRTLTEHNNAGFRIYRADDERYRLITPELIRGAGTTSVPCDYSFCDETAESGMTYWYRLSDISLEGVETFHRPIEVALPGSDELRLQVRVSPNPVRSGADIQFALPKPMPARVELHDLTGRVIATLAEFDLAQGRNTVRWDRGDTARQPLPPGLYLCTVSAGDQTAATPVLVVP